MRDKKEKMRGSKHNPEQEKDFEYATAYRASTVEHYTTGLDSILANAVNTRSDIMAGEFVRLTCAMNEATHYSDGTIKVNRNFPPREEMSFSDRVSVRMTKILAGIIGESHITRFTPIPDEKLSPESLAKFQQMNKLIKDLKIQVSH